MARVVLARLAKRIEVAVVITLLEAHRLRVARGVKVAGDEAEVAPPRRGSRGRAS